MDKITIQFESTNNISDINLEISINNSVVAYSKTSTSLEIESSLILSGINYLKIKTFSDVNNQILKLKKFFLNNALSRQTLFLAYSTANGVNYCNTWLRANQELTIPFGNPMSWWIMHTTKKIGLSNFGKNLYDTHKIYYPESVQIPADFPQSMKDWFKFNFDFTYVPKSDFLNLDKLNTIPYFLIDFEYDAEGLYQELLANRHILEDLRMQSNQQAIYNVDEMNNDIWEIYGVIMPESVTGNKRWEENVQLPKDIFPIYHSTLEKLESMGIKISYGFISETSGKTFVFPHNHPTIDYDVYVLALPLGWTPNSIFKIDSVGTMPIDKCFVFNAYNFFHGTIHNLDNTRFVVGINCDFTEYIKQNNLDIK